MKKDKADIVIIGAGAAGSAGAWNLSENTNLKIICLEQGPELENSKFPKSKAEQISSAEFDIDPNQRGLKSDYPIDNTASPISISNFNAVGGSTILYSGHFPRFHVNDFKTHTVENVGEDWPLDYFELEPYYRLNDQKMRVAGMTGDPSYPPIENLDYPIPLGRGGEKLASAFAGLGWHWWPSYSSVISNTGIRKRYIKKGIFNSGLSVAQTYWPLAIKNGVDLRPNCRALQVCLDNFGNAEKVIYEDGDNTLSTIEASVFILACSGAGTPRLLLNSVGKGGMDGICNSSGMVGKNLMLHPLGYVEGLFEEYLETSFGPQGCCFVSNEFYKSRPENGFKRGYMMHVLRGPDPLDTALSLRKFRKLDFGKEFKKQFLESYGKIIPIAIICEDLPEQSNYIELDKDNVDSSGMAGIKVKYSLSDNSKKMLSHGISSAKKVLKYAGAKSIKGFGPVRHTGWHIMGTTKMGLDPATSVVNKFGQTHDVKNLLVIDSSVFTTSAAVNPVATIQALALYFTNNLVKNADQFAPRS